jgi:hypothetical protein
MASALVVVAGALSGCGGNGLDIAVGQIQDSYGSVASPKFIARSNSDMGQVLKAMGMGTSAHVCVTSVAHNATWTFL